MSTIGEAGRVGGEYQVIPLRPSPGAVSLGLAVMALLSREILATVLFGWFGWRPANPWLWPASIALCSLGAALLGLGFGLVALRRRRNGSRKLSLVGVVANSTIVILVVLMIIAFTYIRMR